MKVISCKLPFEEHWSHQCYIRTETYQEQQRILQILTCMLNPKNSTQMIKFEIEVILERLPQDNDVHLDTKRDDTSFFDSFKQQSQWWIKSCLNLFFLFSIRNDCKYVYLVFILYGITWNDISKSFIRTILLIIKLTYKIFV